MLCSTAGSMDECIKRVTGKPGFFLSDYDIPHLQFMDLPNSLLSSNVQKIVNNEMPTNLFPPATDSAVQSDRDPAVGIIREASGSGKSAILDNIDTVLGRKGEVLIVKASYNHGQDLSCDMEMQSKCLMLRFATHIDHEDCIGSQIVNDVLCKDSHNGWLWHVGEMAVAEEALDRMEREKKHRIAFIVDELSDLNEEAPERHLAEGVLSNLNSLLQSAAWVQAERSGRKRPIADNVVTSAFMSAFRRIRYRRD